MNENKYTKEEGGHTRPPAAHWPSPPPSRIKHIIAPFFSRSDKGPAMAGPLCNMGGQG